MIGNREAIIDARIALVGRDLLIRVRRVRILLLIVFLVPFRGLPEGVPCQQKKNGDEARHTAPILQQFRACAHPGQPIILGSVSPQRTFALNSLALSRSSAARSNSNFLAASRISVSSLAMISAIFSGSSGRTSATSSSSTFT